MIKDENDLGEPSGLQVTVNTTVSINQYRFSYSMASNIVDVVDADEPMQRVVAPGSSSVLAPGLRSLLVRSGS